MGLSTRVYGCDSSLLPPEKPQHAAVNHSKHVRHCTSCSTWRKKMQAAADQLSPKGRSVTHLCLIPEQFEWHRVRYLEGECSKVERCCIKLKIDSHLLHIASTSSSETPMTNAQHSPMENNTATVPDSQHQQGPPMEITIVHDTQCGWWHKTLSGAPYDDWGPSEKLWQRAGLDREDMASNPAQSWHFTNR